MKTIFQQSLNFKNKFIVESSFVEMLYLESHMQRNAYKKLRFMTIRNKEYLI